MLLPVLRFNPIARQHRSTRERHVAIMAPLGIGKMRRRAPEAAPIRSRTVLSRSQASLGAILHGQPLSGIWKLLPTGVVQVSHNRNYGERKHALNGSGGRSPCRVKCAVSGAPEGTDSIRLQPVAVTTFLLRVMGRLALQLVFPLEAAHIRVAGALRDGSRPHMLV